MKRWYSCVMLVAVVASVAASPAATLAAADARQADAAPSKTWLLSNASDRRVGPPPGAAETQAELDAIQALADGRDSAALDRISYWDAGAPPYRWTQRAIKYAQSHGVGGNRAVRLVALMNVAINDAVMASADSQQTFHRARPTLANPVVAAPATPGYPDERAAAAGAAERVLAYVFPSDTELFSSWADEAAFSRVEAGVAFPSDATAGRGLGRQVGELAVSWGQNDGSAEKWTGTVPTEPDKWKGTNPIEPLAGTWKPWALSSGSQFRPGPPPTLDSEQMQRDVAEVRDYPRTLATHLVANFWEYYGARAIFEYWNDQTSRLLFEHRMQDDTLAATRTYALVNIALNDAGIACFDGKYAYWSPRPTMVDASITTVFPTPNHPSYPSAHSCFSQAAAAVLAHQFPSDAASLNAIADQAGEARIMAGIHFRADVDAGRQLGQRVAEAVWERGT